MSSINSTELNKLYDAFRHHNWSDFNRIRFDLFDEGNYLVLRNLDLSGLELINCPAQFLAFDKCDLTGANFASTRFFPALFRDCRLKGIDLRHSVGRANFLRCDFRGAIFDETTNFVVPNADTPSEFQDCQFDPGFHAFLLQQGARFSFRPTTYSEFPNETEIDY